MERRTELADALGLYERIAISGVHDRALLDRLTLLPSSVVQHRLALLRGLGLVAVTSDAVDLPEPDVAALAVAGATAELCRQWSICATPGCGGRGRCGCPR